MEVVNAKIMLTRVLILVLALLVLTGQCLQRDREVVITSIQYRDPRPNIIIEKATVYSGADEIVVGRVGLTDGK